MIDLCGYLQHWGDIDEKVHGIRKDYEQMNDFVFLRGLIQKGTISHERGEGQGHQVW
jgi:hypothetical protein